MEQLNRIELRGIIGRVDVLSYGDARVARLSVATTFFYQAKNGDPVIETTWHSVTAWEGKGIADLDSLEKGKAVHIIGRLRSQKYTNAQGEVVTIYEVVAKSLEVLDECMHFEQ